MVCVFVSVVEGVVVIGGGGEWDVLCVRTYRTWERRLSCMRLCCINASDA